MSDQNHNSRGSATIWVITAVAVLAILGLSVYLAKSRSGPGPENILAPEEVVSLPEPQPEPVPPQQKTDQPPAVKQPAVREQQPSRLPEPDKAAPPKLQLVNLAGTLKLSVPFMAERNKIPLDHTCFRRNESPAMSWHGAPRGTQSYVIFLEKRTTDNGEPFINWILFDIPGSESGIQSSLPDAVKYGLSDHNNIGYIGPCEEKGQFTYALRVFALDKILGLQDSVHKHDLIRAMNGHILDAAEQEFIHYYRL